MDQDTTNNTTDLDKRGPGRPTLYTPKLAQAILHDIATSPDSIANIATSHGICAHTVYYWLWTREDFVTAFMQARRSRAIAQLEHLAQTGEQLAAEAETTEDLRRTDLKSRIWAIRDRSAQWHAERAAPDLYAARQQIDMQVTQSPVDLRLAAWQAREAEMRVVDNSESNQQ